MPEQDIFDRFDLGRVPVQPLPAAEVRRRGDRMRRRRTVATTVGAAAAVAVIAIGGVLIGQPGGGDTTPPPVVTPTPTPSAPEPEPPTTIPERFPIDTEDSAPEPPPDDYLASELQYCGEKPLAGVETADARSAQMAGGEMSTAVTLLLFADEDRASRAMENLLGAAAACPEEVTNVAGEIAVLPESDAWPGRTIRTAYPADAKYVNVVQAGPALLLGSWYVAGTPVEEGLAESRATLAEPLAAMDELWDVPGWDAPGPGTPAGNSDGGDIPADFPIDWDAVDLTGDGGEMLGPGRKAQGVVEVSPCDRTVWPATGGERLAFTSTGPEFHESRELVVLASAEEAVAAVAEVRATLDACPTEINEQDPTSNPEQAWKRHDEDTGYEDSVTFSVTYTDGLPGGEVWQLTRVGRAILAVNVGGEVSLQSVTHHVDRLTDITTTVAPEMCTFTEAGC